MPERILAMCSGVFFSGHVLLPSRSTRLTMSQWSALAPALPTQVSLAMMLPQNTTSVGSLTALVGYSAFSHQSHFLLRVTGLRHSSSVSKSSSRSTSGRTDPVLAPRGALPAPMAMKVAPERVTKKSEVHCPGPACSP